MSQCFNTCIGKIQEKAEKQINDNSKHSKSLAADYSRWHTYTELFAFPLEDLTNCTLIHIFKMSLKISNHTSSTRE